MSYINGDPISDQFLVASHAPELSSPTINVLLELHGYTRDDRAPATFLIEAHVDLPDRPGFYMPFGITSDPKIAEDILLTPDTGCPAALRVRILPTIRRT